MTTDDLKMLAKACREADDDKDAEIRRLRKQVEAKDRQLRVAREALEELVDCNERHDAAVAEVIGRPPKWKDAYLDKARTALTQLEAP